jgi:hypothetical protein
MNVSASPGPFQFEDVRVKRALTNVLRRLPAMEGRPIVVKVRPELRAHRGKLLSRGSAGNAIHAGSDMRKRWMVLDSALQAEPGELDRIFVHEAYHFVWVRLGNPVRQSYERLLVVELGVGARGELGWSAERMKETLSEDDIQNRTRRWREYVCESFCDNAAWFYARHRQHPEWTLSRKYWPERHNWFRDYLAGSALSL